MRFALASFFAALISSLIGIPPAAATIDTGDAAVVLGYVGDPPRYAVLGHRDVGGEGWLNTLYLLDLASDASRRLEVRVNGGQGWPFALPPEAHGSADQATYEAALIRAYLASLPEPFQPAVSAGFARVGPEDRVPDNARPRLVARLHVTPTPSMAACERSTEEPCLEQQADGQTRARCSSCRLVTVAGAGAQGQAWVCDPRSTPGQCDCRGTGAWTRLVVTDVDTGRELVGERFLVAPYALLQANIGMETGSTAPPRLEIGELSIHATPRAFIVTGSASHAPTANGTWYPLWAVVPRTGSPTGSP